MNIEPQILSHPPTSILPAFCSNCGRALAKVPPRQAGYNNETGQPIFVERLECPSITEYKKKSPLRKFFSRVPVNCEFVELGTVWRHYLR